jgi:hypothetical protein
VDLGYDTGQAIGYPDSLNGKEAIRFGHVSNRKIDRDVLGNFFW